MKDRIKQWNKRNKWQILAFVIPFIVALAAFIGQGIWPFGERGISIIDSYHQYVPFFSEFQNKLRHFDSLFYSWNGGLGMNFWSIAAYYLASPLNILLLFFPSGMIMECFALIYLIKLGLCGVTFSTYLRKRFSYNGPFLTAFGCCYALSSFVIGYAWNIMWMDCVLLFPIVMLGIFELIHFKKGWLYGITLGLCIVTNYYMAIMICIFSCLYFLLEFLSQKEFHLWPELRKMGTFAGYSLLAGGLGAIMLLPTLYTLMNSQSASSTFPETLKFYHTITELLFQHFAMIEPTDLSGNFNLYCGMAVLFFVPMYLFNRKISLREKILKMALAGFLLLSLNMNLLTYIWHGFHFPNNLPGRFSYIYIFMILIMGFEGWMRRKSCPAFVPAAAGFGWMAFFAFAMWKEVIDPETYTVIVSMAALCIYMLLLVGIRWNGKRKGLLVRLMLFAMLTESCGYAAFGLCMNGTVNRKEYCSDRKEVQQIKKDLEKEENGDFYRVELDQRRSRNDITWHNLPGMSLFSSTVNAGVEHLMGRLGFFAVTNKYSYQGAVPETDAFLNIQYLLSGDEKKHIRDFEYWKAVGETHVYRNTDRLSLGFMVDEDFRNWHYDQSNPFIVINEMMTSALGDELEPFNYFGLTEPEADGIAMTKDTWADWSYEGSEGTIVYTYEAKKTQELYIYFKAAHCSKITAEGPNGSQTCYDEDGSILDIGKVELGDRVTVAFKLDDSYNSGSIKLIAAEHDHEEFDEAMEHLGDHCLDIDEADSTHVFGTIDAGEGGLMFTSIPYDEGWTIKVDGQVVKPEKLADAMIGLTLTEGVHELEFNYVPKGFMLGAAITCVSGILLVIIGYYGYVKKQKKRVKNVKNEDLQM